MRRVFVNELGHEVEIDVHIQPGDEPVLITARGPNSAADWGLTRWEAIALMQNIGDELGWNVPPHILDAWVPGTLSPETREPKEA